MFWGKNMIDLHGISQATFNLIVASEVTSKAVYIKNYQRPEWPGEQSGVTIGIGYDVGQNSRVQFRADWDGKLPEAMLKALERCCGVTGEAAKPLAAALRKTVIVPWDVALDVFSNNDIPRYLEICRRALPGFDKLSPDCRGVILSVVFNRGASFNKPEPRYREMRAIKAAIKSGNLAGIPAQLRAMKRLWPNSRGLRDRRDAEAALFEKGLATQRASFLTAPIEDEDTGRPVNEREGLDDIDSTDDASDDAADDTALPADDDAPPEIVTDEDTIRTAQARLKALGYYDIGRPDGNLAKRTEGAVLAFRNEHDLPLRTTMDNEFLAALAKATPREVDPARASATTADLRADGSETIGLTDRFKKWAGRLFGLGMSGVGGTGFAATMIGKLSDATTISPEMVAVLILALIALFGLAGVGLMVWFIADKIERKRVEDYRKAKNT